MQMTEKTGMERRAEGCCMTVEQLYRLELTSLVYWLDDEFGHRQDATGRKVRERICSIRMSLDETPGAGVV